MYMYVGNFYRKLFCLLFLKSFENSTQKTEPETIYTQLIYIDKNSSDSQQIEETESEG